MDTILLVPMLLSILLIDPILYQSPYLFLRILCGKKLANTGFQCQQNIFYNESLETTDECSCSARPGEGAVVLTCNAAFQQMFPPLH